MQRESDLNQHRPEPSKNWGVGKVIHNLIEGKQRINPIPLVLLGSEGNLAAPIDPLTTGDIRLQKFVPYFLVLLNEHLSYQEHTYYGLVEKGFNQAPPYNTGRAVKLRFVEIPEESTNRIGVILESLSRLDFETNGRRLTRQEKQQAKELLKERAGILRKSRNVSDGETINQITRIAQTFALFKPVGDHWETIWTKAMNVDAFRP